MRAETGPMEFGDDWRGVFIRGDNAMWYAMELERILEYIPEEHAILKGSIISLKNTLNESMQTREVDGVQMMRDFEECLKK